MSTDSGQEVFKTPRLRVRRIVHDDVDAMHRIYGDSEVVRWVGDGVPLDRDGCANGVEVTQRNYSARGYGLFALVEHQSGEVVGFCGLVHPGGQQEAEIKYALDRQWWGQGIATEAAAALLAYGSTEFGFTYVIATTAPENVASHRVLLKAGMTRGRLRRNDDGSATQLFEWRRADEQPA